MGNIITSNVQENNRNATVLDEFGPNQIFLNETGIGNEFSREDLEEGERIGTGSLTYVLKVTYKPTELVLAAKYTAVKLPIKADDDDFKHIQRELTALKNAKSPEIVKFYGFVFDVAECIMLMELMDFDLLRFYWTIQQNGDANFDERALSIITVKLIRAMNYLKEKHRILHRDIKPNNILIKKTGEIKLCDFGVATILATTSSYATTRTAGLQSYYAPERFNSNVPYNVRSDVWSLGVTILEVAQFKHPFRQCKNDYRLLKIHISQFNPPQFIDGYSDEFMKFLYTGYNVSNIKDYPLAGTINEDGLNELRFPNDNTVYPYDANDFEEKDIIATSLHCVKEYLFKPLSKQMAVKTIRLQQGKYQENVNEAKLLKEVHIYRSISSHPNIVDLYGVCFDFNTGVAMLCMELMNMSLYDLYFLVHGKNEKFSEEILGSIFVQLIAALEFCKNKKVIHRDIKPNNILLNYNGDVKLCDFGESRLLENSLASSFVGTISYWPPERFKQSVGQYDATENSHYDVRSDVWSLGITLIETVYGKLPFIVDDKSKKNIIVIQHCIRDFDVVEWIKRCFPYDYSNDLKNLVSACLEKEVNRRPKYDQLKKFPFYQKFSNITQEVLSQRLKDFIAILNDHT